MGCYEMLWNVMKCYEMLWNVMKCYEMLWNVMKCYEMLWNVTAVFNSRHKNLRNSKFKQKLAVCFAIIKRLNG